MFQFAVVLISWTITVEMPCPDIKHWVINIIGSLCLLESPCTEVSE